MCKRLTHYFIFLFIVAISCQSLLVSAATLIIAKNRISSPFLLSDNTSNKNNISPKKITNIDNHYYLLDFIKPGNFIKPIPSSPAQIQSANNNSNALFEKNLYKQGKQFLVDYEDNEFLHNSLIVFSDTKQHLKETDLMLHNLTDNVLLSLKLDSFIQNNQSALQQKNRASLLADERLSTDANQKQDKNAHLYNTEDLTIYSFFRKIFNFQNLFYLIGVATVYYILKGIVKFISIQKQRKKEKQRKKAKHRRRKRHA